MRRFERAHKIPEAGAPPAHNHASLINEPAPRWRDPKDHGATVVSFVVIDSLRALRGSSPPALTSFISACPSLSPSSSSSQPRVQFSATESDYVASQDWREDERDRSYTGGHFKVDARQSTPSSHQPRYPTSLGADGFAQSQQREPCARSAALLHHRSVECNLACHVRDYEAESDDSDSDSSSHEHQRSQFVTSGSSTSRDSTNYALYHSEHAFASSSPVAPFPSLPPPPSSYAATVATGERQASSSPQLPHKPATRGRRKGLTPEEKRKARTCVVDGCNNYIVHKHRCFRHGGGKRCSVEGCNTSAKQRGLCWRHGGSTICKIDGCTRGVKSKGLCWSHGEGKKLQDDTAGSSETVYYCIFDDCYNAPVGNAFCETHSREVTQPGLVYEL